MYSATKQFKSFDEAIDEIFLSDSLAQSDLGMFLGEDIKDFKSMNECVNKIYEESDEGDIINYPEMREDAFSYTTYSGINSVRLSEIKDKSGKKVEGYLCEYSVDSNKPLDYSTAMKTFREAGWQCKDLERTPEQQEEFKNQYEQELIQEIRKNECIPDVNFSVEFVDGDNPYISSHYIANDPFTIQTLLSSHPELSDEVIETIDKQLSAINDVAAPTTYDFNDLMHNDSNFYVEKKKEVKETLNTLKNDLLVKKLKSKEMELGKLEKETIIISEAENLIEEQTKGQNIGDD